MKKATCIVPGFHPVIGLASFLPADPICISSTTSALLAIWRLWVTMMRVLPAWRVMRSSSAMMASPVLLVEVAGGLVGQHQARVLGQGAGDGDALLLAARELVGKNIAPVGQADALQQVEGAGGDVASTRPASSAGQADVLEHGEGGDQVEELEDEAEVVAPEQGALALAEAGDGNARRCRCRRCWACRCRR